MDSKASEDSQFDVWLRLRPFVKVGNKKVSTTERAPVPGSPMPLLKKASPTKRPQGMLDPSAFPSPRGRSKSPYSGQANNNLSSKLKLEIAELGKQDYEAIRCDGVSLWIDLDEKANIPSLNKKSKNRGQQVHFPNIIPDTSKNEELFDSLVKSRVEACFQGNSFTMLTYGISGSGKSHTIFGINPTDPGALNLAAKQIFKRIPELEQEGYIVQVDLSFIEIYNERAYDLLSPDRRSLSIQDEQFGQGVIVADLIIKPLSHFEEFRETVTKAQSRRIVCPNMNNMNSSRSHVIAELAVSIKREEMADSRVVSRLKFVDLAGSEKVNHDHAGLHRRKGPYQRRVEHQQIVAGAYDLHQHPVG